jgi:hypothetical protein
LLIKKELQRHREEECVIKSTVSIAPTNGVEELRTGSTVSIAPTNGVEELRTGSTVSIAPTNGVEELRDINKPKSKKQLCGVSVMTLNALNV